METENRFARMLMDELRLLYFALDTLEMVVVNGDVLGLSVEYPTALFRRPMLMAEIQEEIKRREGGEKYVPRWPVRES